MRLLAGLPEGCELELCSLWQDAQQRLLAPFRVFRPAFRGCIGALHATGAAALTVLQSELMVGAAAPETCCLDPLEHTLCAGMSLSRLPGEVLSEIGGL